MQRTRPPFHHSSEGAYASVKMSRAVARCDGTNGSRKRVSRHGR